MKQDHEEQQRADDETVVTETQEGEDDGQQKGRIHEREDGSLDVEGHVFQKEEVNASKQYMKSAVTRILGAGANAAQCDPVKQEERKGQMSSNVEYGAATAFNATAMNFLTNMLKLFKGDVLILKMIQELHKHMGNKHGMLSKGMPSNVKPVNVPALLFARQTTQVLTLPSGESKTISDLIMDKNEYLAVGDYNVKLLNMLNFKDKYKMLNEKNKEYVWTTLNKLLMSSAMVVMIEHDSMSAVDDLICAVMKKSKTIAKSSGGRMDVKRASQMIATDKDIQKVSKQVLKSAMAGDENLSQPSGASSSSGAASASSEASQKISSEQMGEYIAQVTGKTVDVTGLADKDGMIDMSDSGMERMMSMLSAQGANCVRKETAKEAVTRERLKKKLLQRQLEKNAATPAPTTTTNASATATSDASSLPSHAVDQTMQLLMSDAPPLPQQQPQATQTKKKKKKGGEKKGSNAESNAESNTVSATTARQPQQQQHGGESDRERNRRMKSEVDELMRKMQL
jgi:hypothetical protein